MQLAEVLAVLNQVSPEVRAQITREALEGTKRLRWVANPGPQQQAKDCLADELFYGGKPGGGKSDLMIGLSLTAHRRSLVLRRTNKEASKLVERYTEILGSRDGWSSQDGVWRIDGKIIDIGGCQLEDDKQKYKGSPHDLIAFDELPDFTESQYRFITIWNRSTDKHQRCRVVCAGNPPTTPEGLWVLKYWGPWLDPTHANPAVPGELRWFLAGDEVDGPGPYPVDMGDGTTQMIRAKSRTFIPADLADNPDLAETGYSSVLAGLSGELREAYFKGRFDAVLKDKPGQVIPTAWVKQAQKRWTPKPPQGVPMCAIGVDPSQGGEDDCVLAPRYDGWYDKLIVYPAKGIKDGSEIAGYVVQHRRHDAKIVIDMGGGYGGAPYVCLKENIGTESVVGYKGAEKSVRRTTDKQLAFFNKRAQVYWQFHEALDPSQSGGSPIFLPEDPELVADLTAPTFKIGPRGIKITPKEELVDQLGRSPNKGDAVVMAWYSGAKLPTHYQEWQEDQRVNRRAVPKVNMGARRNY